MRDFFETLGVSVQWAIIAIIAAVVLAAGYILLYAGVGQRQVQIDRMIVENSKGYNDSSNIAVANFISSYLALDGKALETTDAEVRVAYRAQQRAILMQICMQTKTMTQVAPSALRFIQEHGGCQ